MGDRKWGTDPETPRLCLLADRPGASESGVRGGPWTPEALGAVATVLLTQLLHTSLFCPEPGAPARTSAVWFPPASQLLCAGAERAQAKGCPLALHPLSQGPGQCPPL